MPLIDVGTQAVKRDTLLERYPHGGNCVSAPPEDAAGRMSPTGSTIAVTENVCKDFISHSFSADCPSITQRSISVVLTLKV